VGREVHREALGGAGLRSSVAGRAAAALAALAARRRLIHIQINMTSSGSGRSTCFVAGVRGDAPGGASIASTVQHGPGTTQSVSIRDSTPIWAVPLLSLSE
jgi:hypothetical protein